MSTTSSSLGSATTLLNSVLNLSSRSSLLGAGTQLMTATYTLGTQINGLTTQANSLFSLLAALSGSTTSDKTAAQIATQLQDFLNWLSSFVSQMTTFSSGCHITSPHTDTTQLLMSMQALQTTLQLMMTLLIPHCGSQFDALNVAWRNTDSGLNACIANM
ncbi:hypothetical protein B0H11DRAFT_2071763 [Mycena galericulata]|nr:hypothetical protein B0H11DRAFT_2071763 [Mycena galericulata]